MIGLADCNNFYASCERVFRPDLIDKPIVVLSNNDGCVIARSNEAKAIGIPMGAPAFEYESLFDRHNVHVFSANFSLYGDMSNRVMSILASLCPSIEIYSIDEAFLDFKNLKFVNLQEYASTIRQTIIQNTGISVSIGIAQNKSLAKIANKIAKKYPRQTNGIYVIDNEEKQVKALKWLKIEDVWGIGRQHSKRLNAIGVKTAYDFTKLNKQWLKKNMSIVGLRLQDELCGIPVLDFEIFKPKKNIATTRSFERHYTTYSELSERIVTFAVACSEKLRRQKSMCNSIQVFLMTNYFRSDHKQYNNSVTIKLPYSTNSAIELAHFAELALKRIFKEGYAYKKAGVILLDFTPEDHVQSRLFENSDPKHKEIMKAMDFVNSKIASHKVKLASQDPNRVWKMRQERLSPCYTTKLSDIITIK